MATFPLTYKECDKIIQNVSYFIDTYCDIHFIRTVGKKATVDDLDIDTYWCPEGASGEFLLEESGNDDIGNAVDAVVDDIVDDVVAAVVGDADVDVDVEVEVVVEVDNGQGNAVAHDNVLDSNEEEAEVSSGIDSKFS